MITKYCSQGIPALKAALRRFEKAEKHLYKIGDIEVTTQMSLARIHLEKAIAAVKEVRTKKCINSF